jgi:hypothetical protein
MKTVLWRAVAATIALASCGAAAEEVISNPTGVVPYFGTQNLAIILDELGYDYETRANGTIAAVVGDLQIVLAPMACVENRGCVGLNTLAMFDGEASPQALSAFDQAYIFTSVGALSNQPLLYVSRYDIADYGIARGNVQSSLANFIFLAKKFQAEVVNAAGPTSTSGYGDDRSAAALNRRAAGAELTANSVSAALHRAALEATPELVRALATDEGGALVNKIRNVTP